MFCSVLLYVYATVRKLFYCVFNVAKFQLERKKFPVFYEWMESQEKRKNVNFYFLDDTFFSFSFVSFFSLWLSIKKEARSVCSWAFLFSNPWRRNCKKNKQKKTGKNVKRKTFFRSRFLCKYKILLLPRGTKVRWKFNEGELGQKNILPYL